MRNVAGCGVAGIHGAGGTVIHTDGGIDAADSGFTGISGTEIAVVAGHLYSITDSRYASIRCCTDVAVVANGAIRFLLCTAHYSGTIGTADKDPGVGTGSLSTGAGPIETCKIFIDLSVAIVIQSIADFPRGSHISGTSPPAVVGAGFCSGLTNSLSQRGRRKWVARTGCHGSAGDAAAESAEIVLRANIAVIAQCVQQFFGVRANASRRIAGSCIVALVAGGADFRIGAGASSVGTDIRLCTGIAVIAGSSVVSINAAGGWVTGVVCTGIAIIAIERGPKSTGAVLTGFSAIADRAVGAGEAVWFVGDAATCCSIGLAFYDARVGTSGIADGAGGADIKALIHRTVAIIVDAIANLCSWTSRCGIAKDCSTAASICS